MSFLWSLSLTNNDANNFKHDPVKTNDNKPTQLSRIDQLHKTMKDGDAQHYASQYGPMYVEVSAVLNDQSVASMYINKIPAPFQSKLH